MSPFAWMVVAIVVAVVLLLNWAVIAMVLRRYYKIREIVLRKSKFGHLMIYDPTPQQFLDLLAKTGFVSPKDIGLATRMLQVISFSDTIAISEVEELLKSALEEFNVNWFDNPASPELQRVRASVTILPPEDSGLEKNMLLLRQTGEAAASLMLSAYTRDERGTSHDGIVASFGWNTIEPDQTWEEFRKRVQAIGIELPEDPGYLDVGQTSFIGMYTIRVNEKTEVRGQSVYGA